MKEQTIVITWPDHARLTDLVERQEYKKERLDAEAFKRLASELARARLVTAEDIPPDVVTMNSVIRVRDLDADEEMTFTLSWPDAADSISGRINVLAPLGMALLGSRVGAKVKWEVPGGKRQVRVEKILFQPEREEATEKS